MSVQVESACEKALFATPEAVASAVAYVEARYSLLVASAALAARDPSYQPTVERLRRGIEDDRFGLVAQVFSTRGCNAPDCADFAVLRDSRRILANMKGHVFAAHVAAYGLAWPPGGAASALASATPSSAAPRPYSGMVLSPAASEVGAMMPAPASSSGGTGRPRYEYPSADTIPPISIMDPETDPPGVAQQKRSAVAAAGCARSGACGTGATAGGPAASGRPATDPGADFRRSLTRRHALQTGVG